MENRFMEVATQLAAQCWCDEETKHIEMDTDLAHAVAKRINSWMEAAAHAEDGANYYRCLLVKCGETIGDRAYIADDGTRSTEVLVAKIPEIIEQDYVNSPN